MPRGILFDFCVRLILFPVFYQLISDVFASLVQSVSVQWLVSPLKSQFLLHCQNVAYGILLLNDKPVVLNN